MTLHKRLQQLNQGQLANVLNSHLRIDPFLPDIGPESGSTDAELYMPVEWLRKKILDAVIDGTVTEDKWLEAIDEVTAPVTTSDQRRRRFNETLGLQDIPKHDDACPYCGGTGRKA